MRHASAFETLKSIRRVHGTAQEAKAAQRTVVLREALALLPPGLRDCALLLVGYAGAPRRSKLTALEVPDLARPDSGLRIALLRSKTG